MIKSIEIWCSVKGYEGLYEVSDQGRVRNAKTGRILKGTLTKKGYVRICFMKNGYEKNFFLQRLIAETFIPNPLNLPCVNHINEIKTDNRVKNLEWCDFAYNNTFGHRVEKVTAKLKNHPSFSKRVIQYTHNWILVDEYESGAEAARKTGVHQGHISDCCLGKQKTAGGFIWRYA